MLTCPKCQESMRNYERNGVHIDQCNGYLWLLGRQWVDLVLWAPDLEAIGLAMTIHRITRDEAAIESLEADLLAFAGRVDGYEEALRSAAKRAAK